MLQEGEFRLNFFRNNSCSLFFIYFKCLLISSKISYRLFAAGVLKCPSHVPLYQAWACLELRSENADRAKILISEALTRDKSQGSSWLIAAKIEEKLGNGGLVGLILQRGLECSPNDPELYRAAAELEVKRGHFQVVRFIRSKQSLIFLIISSNSLNVGTKPI